MRKILVALVVVVSISSQASAQFLVFDPLNFAQLVQIVEKTTRTIETLKTQYDTITRMSKGLTNLRPYQIPMIVGMAHDVARFPYGGTWLDGLNSGDPRGDRYFATVHPLQKPNGGFDGMSPEAQAQMKAAYATIEILDSVAMMGGHSAGTMRGYQGMIQNVIQVLERDVINPNPAYHSTTAVADKIAAGQLVARRSDMASNQLESNILEQQIAASKRRRDADAAAMNMRIYALQDGGRMDASLMDGSESALRNWRQP